VSCRFCIGKSSVPDAIAVGIARFAFTASLRLQSSPSDAACSVAAGELQVECRVTFDIVRSAHPLTVDFYLADETGEQPLRYLGSDSYQAPDAHLLRTVKFCPPRLWR
jgi:hypothetical protein